jgi:tripartite-type tricarboxylate transporter receptor subunit TctC
MKQSSKHRFAAVIIVISILALLWASDGRAQFPNRPITLVCGWPAGGITDVTARALSEAAAKEIGQPIMVLNKPGGGTAVSLAYLKGEKPDGYTLATLSSSGTIIPYMRKVPYDVNTDFTPIMGFAENIGGVVVRADSQWKDFKALLEYAKGHPGKIKYATTGVGTNHHLAMERLGLQEGVKWVHIPFKGGHDVITGILGGHVEVAATSPDWVPHVQSGKLRLLSLYSSARLPKFPDVPTWAELGLKISAKITTSIIGPKGMPGPVVEKLHAAFKKGLEDANFKKALDNFEMVTYYRDPKALAKDIREYTDQWGKLIVQLGLRQD